PRRRRTGASRARRPATPAARRRATPAARRRATRAPRRATRPRRAIRRRRATRRPRRRRPRRRARPTDVAPRGSASGERRLAQAAGLMLGAQRAELDGMRRFQWMTDEYEGARHPWKLTASMFSLIWLVVTPYSYF